MEGSWQPNGAIVDSAKSRQASDELALIQVAASRAKLLRQKLQDFTPAERQIVKQGEWALQQLLNAHRALIQKLVSLYQTHKSEFGDFEQEAILAFLSAVATYESTKGSRLSTWAYVQIRQRLQKTRRELNQQVVATAKARHNQEDLTACESIRDPRFIRAGIELLTRKQRDVVFLHLDGFSWTDIAQTLQTTADAVRMLWTRAIQRIRRFLLREEQETQGQPPRDVLSQQETKNHGEPLLRRLFRPLSPNWVWNHPLMLESLESRKSLTNPLLQLGVSSGAFLSLLAIARQRQWLASLCRLNDFVCRCFDLNPSCVNGVRGSPRQIFIKVFHALQRIA